MNVFKKYHRAWFVIVLTATFTAIGCLLNEYSNPGSPPKTAQWLATIGLLSTVAGIIQLEVSGLFEKIYNEYSNVEKYPYGPPSNITRQIIDNPDTPKSTWLRNLAFYDIRTGFWLIVLGTLIQIPAVWLA